MTSLSRRALLQAKAKAKASKSKKCSLRLSPFPIGTLVRIEGFDMGERCAREFTLGA